MLENVGGLAKLFGDLTDLLPISTSSNTQHYLIDTSMSIRNYSPDIYS